VANIRQGQTMPVACDRRRPSLAADDARRLQQTSLAAHDMRQTSIVIDNFTPPDIDRCAFFL